LLAAPEYARVQAISRRPLPLEHARLANRVLRFDAPLEGQLKNLAVQDAFCCLGTTLRAAGSQAAFAPSTTTWWWLSRAPQRPRAPSAWWWCPPSVPTLRQTAFICA
jgi:hypothetical protein